MSKNEIQKLILRSALTVLFVTGMGASPFSCGKSSAPSPAAAAAAASTTDSGSSSPVAGTCNRVALVSNCSEYLTDSASLAVYQSECLSPDIWSSGLVCPATGVIGVCTMSADAGDSEIYYSTASAVYHSGWSNSTASSACAAYPGVWAVAGSSSTPTPTPSSYSGPGSCTTSADNFCTDYVGTYWTAGNVESGCTGSGGAYSAAACPIANRVGSCDEYSAASDADHPYEMIQRYYSVGSIMWSAGYASQYCTGTGTDVWTNN